MADLPRWEFYRNGAVADANPTPDGRFYLVADVDRVLAIVTTIKARLNDDKILASFGICPDAGCTHPTCATVRSYRTTLREEME